MEVTPAFVLERFGFLVSSDIGSPGAFELGCDGGTCIVVPGPSRNLLNGPDYIKSPAQLQWKDQDRRQNIQGKLTAAHLF